MIKLKENFGEATVYSNVEEDNAINQIKDLLNQEWTKDLSIKIMPDYHAGSGCVIGTTMNIKDKVVPNLVGVDIGCLDKDTEYLTKKGWKKINEYSEGEEILQYNQEDDTANFITPLAYLVKDCDEFYHFKNNKGLDQMLSEEHKMLIWKGFKGKGYNLENFTPLELSTLGDRLDNGYYGVKTAFNIEGNEGVDLTDNEIRLDIMISADGCIKYSRGSEHQIYLHLKKERKIKRAEHLLNLCNIPYKHTIGVDGTSHIYFFIDKIYNKDLAKYWSATSTQLSVIAEECLLWDGHRGYRSYFSSTDKKNADVIQFAFTSTNIRAGITKIEPKKVNHKTCYNVIPTKNNIIGVTNDVKKVKSQDGKKYCFTVPTGYFVARRNGKIFITGNCGMLTVSLGREDINMLSLDRFIHQNIPSGFCINQSYNESDFAELKNLKCLEIINYDRAMKSIGTLGGGNHFIEIARNSDGENFLVIHTGSRNLGLQVANHYQNIAVLNNKEHIECQHRNIILKLKETGNESNIQEALLEHKKYWSNFNAKLCYLEGEDMEDYLHDMKIIQKYASVNRIKIANKILTKLGLNLDEQYHFETIHNYIDIENMILRKGAVSANKCENLIIPINMRDGSLICVGKGNPESNFSAPHGAGRLMSRGEAKKNVDMVDYKNSMVGVFSTCINSDTLDESPFAYKPIEEIMRNIKDMVDIVDIIRPIYNFKASN